MGDHYQQQQFGVLDLRQLVNGARSANFQAMLPIQATADVFSGTHRNLNPNRHPHQHEQHLEMLMFRPHQLADVMPPVLHDFATDSISPPTTVSAAGVATNPITTASTLSLSGFEVETSGCLGGDATTGRWPRQETLTLLEIRSRLDPKFKEANQKGPLWDEVSRILSEEHGYQRCGKKCREKFENLYKYYKKTKEGKAGRQDGKNYRFFRQLEALCGESSSNPTSFPGSNFVGSSFDFQAAVGQNPSTATYENFQAAIKYCDSLSLTNTTEFDTSSTDVNDLSNEALMENDSLEKRRKRRSSSRRGWKANIKKFIDSQMKKLMEKQEAWLERLTKILEQKEKERMLREEEWRKQEAARLEREHKFWGRERAWIEARDDALMEALQKLTGRQIKGNSPDHHVVLMAAEIQNHSENNHNEDGSEILNSNAKVSDQSWSDSEITSLIQLIYEMGSRFQQCGGSEQNLWEEMAIKMACSGYEQRSGLMYKNKWESIQKCNRNIKKENNKKRKEKPSNCYYESIDQPSLYNQRLAYCDANDGERQEIERFRDDTVGCSPSNSNAGNAISDSCFRFFMTEGESIWENYGMKLNKLANQNQ